MQRKTPQIIDGEPHWQCYTCESYKPAGDFYKNNQKFNGLFGECKACYNERQKRYAARIKPERKDRRNARMREWRDENRENLRIQNKQKYAENPEKYKSRVKASQQKHPLKQAARVALGHAIRDGKISRPRACSACGRECTPHGHHHDYNKPLEVIWLCPSCHQRLHHSDTANQTGRLLESTP